MICVISWEIVASLSQLLVFMEFFCVCVQSQRDLGILMLNTSLSYTVPVKHQMNKESVEQGMEPRFLHARLLVQVKALITVCFFYD